MAKKSKDLTSMEIVFVLDRSGSMHTMKTDAIGGFNSFVAEQAKDPGECRLSLLQFDDEHQVDYEGVPVGDIAELTDETFVPRGRTALRDAIARGVGLLTERIGKGLGVLAILTDGRENASTEIGGEDLKLLLEDCEAKGWGVLYLGANQDAVAVAVDLGIKPARASTFDGQNVKSAYLSAGSNVRSMRSTGDVTRLSFSATQRRGMVATPDNGDLVGSVEAAHEIGVSVSTLKRREKDGTAPPSTRATPTAHRRYRRGSLRAYLQEGQD